MSLKIAARMIAHNRQSARGLIGTIQRQDFKRKDQYVGDYTIPVFGHTSSVSTMKIDDLEPGAYLVQLSLPNGRVITKKFEIAQGADTEVIIDLPHEGPHEWSSLQGMTGTFASEAAISRRFTKSFSVAPTDYSKLRSEPERGYSLSLLTPGETPAGEIFDDAETLTQFSELISQDLDIRSASKRLGALHAIEHPSQYDDDFAMFRFGHSGLLEGDGEDPDFVHFGPGTTLNRHYLVQQSRFGAQLISLPTPWMTPEGQASVELLVKTHSMKGRLDYSMTIGDPMVNSALGYINIGAMQKAQQLIDASHAEKMLYQKVSFPLAATIGGYILVLNGNTSQYRSNSDKWKPWVENLDHWFDWLPDGAILNATMCLMDKNPDLEAAREALQRGFGRGLPIFTFGLKYLMDGVRYFGGLGEPWARGMLKALQPIAMQADPGIPFLSVSYAHKWEQKKEPVLAGAANVRHA